MRSSSSDPGPDRSAVLDRRLAVLAGELSATRPARPPAPPEPSEPWWEDHTHVASDRWSSASSSVSEGRSAGARGGTSAGTGLKASAASPPPASPAGHSARSGSSRAVAHEAPPHRALPAAPPAGRHAARHGPLLQPPTALRGLTGRATDGLLTLAAPQLAVVAVLVTLGLVVAGWWLLRGDAHPADELRAAPAAGLVSPAAAPAEPVADAGGSGDTATDTATGTTAAGTSATTATGASAAADAASSSGTTAATGAAGPPGTVTVDVAGKVRHPGIVVLSTGARVVDALTAAGGARPGVDLTALNQARVLVDGEQLLVGVPPARGIAAAAATTGPTTTSPGTSSSATSSSALPPGTLVNLNTATSADLDALPEVGPVTAASILEWREENGGFTSVDELLEVNGIGEATLAKIAPYVTV